VISGGFARLLAGRGATGRQAYPRNRQAQRGAAAVETAIVLPVLLFVLFGLIDFGRMIRAQIDLTQAAREGVRAAALPQYTLKDSTGTAIYASRDAQVQAKVAAATAMTGVTTTGSDNHYCPYSPTPTETAIVVVRYNFQFITPIGTIAAPLLGHSFNSSDVAMSATGEMACTG
jgi:Flp pilus assembly protein TadG